ncbi:hypothetical protein DFQ27_006558 [Actinomortierella ambigua]|uniref:DUF221-domain-containing protein n=1 Tax=Actinomortierella ambigua TaxID=1343610 RepID=A0A9P6QJ70_9FUNG|nr:hypothetical protein DFQ27_006558 [Actinomortierella ambigua]
MTSIANINPDLQAAALGINVGTNVALSLITLGAFCWLRPKNGVVYEKKYQVSPEEKRAPKLASGYFSWMGPVYHCPDEVLAEKIGLDAVVFIRFIRMCRNIFIALMILGCGALIPINIIISKRGLKPEDEQPDTIQLMTMSGVLDVNWMWAHVGAMWLFSLIVLAAVWWNYKKFLDFRIKYYESSDYQTNVASRTLMLASLPTSLQSDEKIMQLMSSLGVQDQPVQALVGRKVNGLPELMKKHKEMVTQLEQVMTKYFADAIDYYSQQIEQLADQIEQTRAAVSKSAPTNYGFVSYATIQAAHRVAKEVSSVIVWRQRTKMVDPPDVFLSPDPKDIVWINVSNPKQLRQSRAVIVKTLFVVASFLFFIPMMSLSAFSRLENLIGYFPSTEPWFDEHPFVFGIVQSLLPIIFMDILFLIIRKLITYLAFIQGNITKSSTDRSTLAKFYLFFTVNNLIVLALSSTILGFFSKIKYILENGLNSSSWEQMKEFMASQDILKLLAEQVISTSLFWINYLSLRNFGALLDLFQLISLFTYWAKASLTPRQAKALDKPPVFDFPLYFSSHLFLLTVALLYSVMAPLALVFATVYFSLSCLVYKYQLMYVFRTKVETGGRLFRVVFNRVIAALLLFQVVMIGVINVKKAHWHTIAIVPLPILSVLFKIFLTRQYDPRIDFYDYGSTHNEAHLYTNKPGKGDADQAGSGANLSAKFENPALNARMVAALVPDAAKKMLSSRVLNGGNDHKKDTKKDTKKDAKKDTKTKNGSAAASSQGTSGSSPVGSGGYQKQSSMGYDRHHHSQHQHTSNEVYEMGHLKKGAKPTGPGGFQLLGADPLDGYLSDDAAVSANHRHQQPSYQKQEYQTSQQQQQYYAKQEYEGPASPMNQPRNPYRAHNPVDMPDSVSGNSTQQQQQSSPAYTTQPPQTYGSSDMTSFVAGRYQADQAYNPRTQQYGRSGPSTTRGGNGASINESKTSTPEKPNYLEMARVHQTDNYKTTGKATQYEEARSLHLPPAKNIFVKSPRHQQQQQQQQQQQTQPGSSSFVDPSAEQPLSPTTTSTVPGIENPFSSQDDQGSSVQQHLHSASATTSSPSHSHRRTPSSPSSHRRSPSSPSQRAARSPRMLQDSSTPRSPTTSHRLPQRMQTEPALHHSRSSPALSQQRQQQQQYEYQYPDESQNYQPSRPTRSQTMANDRYRS